MTERKGQHLFNEIAKKNKLTSWEVGIREIGMGKISYRTMPTNFLYVELHQILFNMTDSEFDEIMSSINISQKESTK